jgi:hypothetical protein
MNGDLIKHGVEPWKIVGLDHADDLEPVPLIKRDVPRIGALQIGRQPLLIAFPQAFLDERGAQPMPLAGRVGPDQRKVPMRFVRVVLRHLFDHLAEDRLLVVGHRSRDGPAATRRRRRLRRP